MSKSDFSVAGQNVNKLITFHDNSCCNSGTGNHVSVRHNDALVQINWDRTKITKAETVGEILVFTLDNGHKITVTFIDSDDLYGTVTVTLSGDSNENCQFLITTIWG